MLASERAVGADDISSGERNNLIIWNHNLEYRNSDEYLNRPYFKVGFRPRHTHTHTRVSVFATSLQFSNSILSLTAAYMRALRLKHIMLSCNARNRKHEKLGCNAGARHARPPMPFLHARSRLRSISRRSRGPHPTPTVPNP